MPSPITVFKSLVKLMKAHLTAGNVQDARGKRFIAVIDCILNQNARLVARNGGVSTLTTCSLS
jgi:hypothetical protein